MRLIEINALSNGAHRNQIVFGNVTSPDGWAIIPDDMETPNFPFGDVEVENIVHYRKMTTEEGTIQKPYTIPTVTKWEPLPIPEPEPGPEKSSAELREETYNTEPIIDWEGDTLTVTQAAQKWQYYAAEGSDKAEQLQALIAEAKTAIREKYPDEEET